MALIAFGQNPNVTAMGAIAIGNNARAPGANELLVVPNNNDDEQKYKFDHKNLLIDMFENGLNKQEQHDLINICSLFSLFGYSNNRLIKKIIKHLAYENQLNLLLTCKILSKFIYFMPKFNSKIDLFGDSNNCMVIETSDATFSKYSALIGNNLKIEKNKHMINLHGGYKLPNNDCVNAYGNNINISTNDLQFINNINIHGNNINLTFKNYSALKNVNIIGNLLEIHVIGFCQDINIIDNNKKIIIDNGHIVYE